MASVDDWDIEVEEVIGVRVCSGKERAKSPIGCIETPPMIEDFGRSSIPRVETMVL